MTPTDFAAEELALWERALRDQHEVERQLAAARKTKHLSQYYALLSLEEEARLRADLLLAKAVEKKRSCPISRSPASC